jgi:hypothetical protein
MPAAEISLPSAASSSSIVAGADHEVAKASSSAPRPGVPASSAKSGAPAATDLERNQSAFYSVL